MEYPTNWRAVPIYPTRRTFPPLDAWVPRLEAWLPTYVTGYGNLVDVTLENGDRFYIGVHTKRMWEMVARYHLIDTGELKRRYRELHGMSQNVPLPVAPRRTVLAAFKSRATCRVGYKNDGAMGYIAVARIACIEEAAADRVHIHLRSGRILTHLPMSLRHCRSQVMRAENFYLHLLREGVIADGGWQRL
ncbi:hypothetical protein GCM10010885_23810 [Alicyclobacillus cellulosilyticus]|uniref:ComK protein n=1 Tax=Alicyclobacillus cellulosilyticus TaxID=1003997 RepID=A0A917NNE0_9BACL|nr:hypothetical protein [Alicyclobacillus cellulosilyticus]GGJ13710.1 hypothetical protein GCM10010885_23810 [Alicyclobacillus cellulosilyticus]